MRQASVPLPLDSLKNPSQRGSKSLSRCHPTCMWLDGGSKRNSLTPGPDPISVPHSLYLTSCF